MIGHRTSIPLGRIFGIPVTVSWSVVAVAVVGSWLLATDVFPRIDSELLLRWRLALAAGGVVFFLASILAHEFGHALVARRHQIHTSSIRLWIFGGVAALSSPARSPRAEFQIAIAGPGANAALAAAFLGIAELARQLGAPQGVPVVATGLAILNILLTVTNLIPAAPLDGGKVLSSILWARTGRAEWARLISARSGLIGGALVIVYGLVELIVWDRVTGFYTAAIGGFIFVAARADVVSASIRGRLAKTSVKEILWHYPPAVHDSASLTDIQRHLGPEAVSVPVQRWAHQTIGYLSTSIMGVIPADHHSWTSVGQVMTPTEFMPSAWTSESLLVALERIGPEPDQFLGLDPETGTVVGTATPRQFAHLMRHPRLWGGV
ncbi:MAG: site-2 protease family protein [Acidimicrobiales bacterium]